MPPRSASKTIKRDPSWMGPAISPGEILLEEYLKPLGIGQVEAYGYGADQSPFSSRHDTPITDVTTDPIHALQQFEL